MKVSCCDYGVKIVDFNHIKEVIKDFLLNSFSYNGKASEEEIYAKKRNIMIASAAAAVVMIFIFSLLFFTFRVPDEYKPDDKKEIIYVRIVPGMGSDAIANKLVEKGVISSKTKFWIASKLNGADTKFKVGTFAMTRDMNVGDAISALIHGKTVSIWITIPEGFNVKEIAQRLDEKGLCSEDEFLKLAKDYAPYSYMEANPDTMYRVEGFLFPDTYEFSSDATAKDIMRRMIDEFDNKLTDDMRQKAQARNMSVYELVTMASLIEKEALYETDLPLISQIFWKRIEINMPLQSCATIQYILGTPKEDLSIADTKLESPYNTYQKYGLPPGPIANPGLRSLKAALEPADTDYLYFVADRNGKTYFTGTYDEHIAKVGQVR